MLKRKRVDILFGIAYIILMALLIAFLMPTKASGEDMTEVHSLDVDGITDAMAGAVLEVQEDLESITEYEYLATFVVTAYCPCTSCSGRWGWQTSTGAIAEEGRTIAVDPSVIPYGTVVYIDGVGEFVAEDCGSAIKGNDIDIFMESHAMCDEWGVQHKEVYVKKERH